MTKQHGQKTKQICKGVNESIGSKACPVSSSFLPQLSSSISRKTPLCFAQCFPLRSKKALTKTNSNFLHTRTLPVIFRLACTYLCKDKSGWIQEWVRKEKRDKGVRGNKEIGKREKQGGRQEGKAERKMRIKKQRGR